MSTSEDNDLILQVSNLNLVFTPDVHRAWNWRDVFTQVLTDPVGMLLAEHDRLHVCKNLNFSIRRGDRVGLVGVNGAGKTSLCRCLAGMYNPTSGKVEMNGEVRAIFDSAVGIHPELTGRENAELIARFMFPKHPKPQEIVEEALEFSELGSFVDVPYRLYSNGMQTRLCLSIISAQPSDLLILDEVFDGADAFFKEKAAKRVLNMIQNSGAVVFVSHSPDQILKACNRVLLLHQGQILFDGDVNKGLEMYQNLGPQAIDGRLNKKENSIPRP